jgi:hypothetical protein
MSPDRSAWHRARRPCAAAHRGTQPWFTPPRPRVGRMPTIPPPVPGPLPPPPMARTSSTSATTMATRVWPGGGPDPRRSWLHQHRRRAAPSRGVWSSATTIVTGAHLSLASSLVAPDGSMAVAWKSFSAVCGSPTCTTSNWVLHVSTRAAGAQSWIDSGPLLGPDSKQHFGRLAADGVGDLGVLTISGSNIVPLGPAWQQLDVAIGCRQDFSDQPHCLCQRFRRTVTLVGFDYHVSTILAVDGDLTNNTWGSPRRSAAGTRIRTIFAWR